MEQINSMGQVNNMDRLNNVRQVNSMKQDCNFKKTLLIAMAISLSIGALLGIFAFLFGGFFGDFGEINYSLLITPSVIAGYILTGLSSSILYEKRKFTPLALSGMLISIIGFLYTILAIWQIINLTSDKTLTIFAILAASIAHACLLSLVKSEKLFVSVSLSLTIIFISIVALMLIVLTLSLNSYMHQFYIRLLEVFAILDVLGTIVTLILDAAYSTER